MTRIEFEISRKEAMKRYYKEAMIDLRFARIERERLNAKRRIDLILRKEEEISNVGFWNVPGMEAIYETTYSKIDNLSTISAF